MPTENAAGCLGSGCISVTIHVWWQPCLVAAFQGSGNSVAANIAFVIFKSVLHIIKHRKANYESERIRSQD